MKSYAHRLVSAVTYDLQGEITLFLVVDNTDQADRSTNRFTVDPDDHISSF